MRKGCRQQDYHDIVAKITGVRWAESLYRSKSAGVVRVIGKPKTTRENAEKFGANFSVTEQGGIIMNDDNDASRRLVEYCYRTTSTMVNPIVDWTDDEVWEFLHHYGCESNPLYKCGRKRIGCIGCPLAPREAAKDFVRYPKYKQIYIHTFDRMLKEREKRGKTTKWKTGEEVFAWWTGEDKDQISITEVFDL